MPGITDLPVFSTFSNFIESDKEGMDLTRVS